ncbi:MAG TPA: hypothetical protein VGH28_12005 [Polyangiaceae bacterium]|jgi:hypothetical protein
MVLGLIGVGVVAACSLNPQPYPPDTNDGGFGGADATAGDAANAFGDGGSSEDAALEAEPPPQPDASDASDGESDAEGDAQTDASDAESDDAADATTD